MSAEIGAAFKNAGIVSDVTAIPPANQLTLEYGDGLVTPGQLLTPQQAQEAPKVKWTADIRKKYTLLMVDPDAISRGFPIFRSVLHWLVVNIPGNSVSEGEVKAAYRGPGPPKWSGAHRYTFLVFEQEGEQNIDMEPYSWVLGRVRFSLDTFKTIHKLSSVPVAGNYFLAQHD